MTLSIRNGRPLSVELNSVSQTDEERLVQFELKRKIVNPLVEKVYNNKERSLEVTIRLNLLQIVQQRVSADKVPQVGTCTPTGSRPPRCT
jgi:hypothetical protein